MDQVERVMIKNWSMKGCKMQGHDQARCEVEARRKEKQDVEKDEK